MKNKLRVVAILFLITLIPTTSVYAEWTTYLDLVEDSLPANFEPAEFSHCEFRLKANLPEGERSLYFNPRRMLENEGQISKNSVIQWFKFPADYVDLVSLSAVANIPGFATGFTDRYNSPLGVKDIRIEVAFTRQYLISQVSYEYYEAQLNQNVVGILNIDFPDLTDELVLEKNCKSGQ